MNATKKKGRPKVFDENTALKAAVEVFWAKGFEGASMKDLTTAMGINPPSLYASYGDKNQLFLKAIKYYIDNGNCAPIEVLENTPDIKSAVVAFFKTIIATSSQNKEGLSGCFLSSCVATSAETIPAAKESLQAVIIDSEKRIKKRLDEAIKAGQLPSDFPTKQRARLMFDLRQGPVFKARAGFSAKALEQDVNFWAQCILKF